MSSIVEAEKRIIGNITKKPEPGAPDYRKAWIANVNEYNNGKDGQRGKPHPFCHGIQMDTHHLISGKALADLDESLQEALIDKGYNVNSLGNLVGLPSTFKGACHLGIQVHRTRHSFKKNDFSEVNESDYHEKVQEIIERRERAIKSCYGTTEQEESKRDIHKNHMDQISQRLLDRLLNFELLLTRVGSHFDRGNTPYIGCANKDKIGELKVNLECCVTENNDHRGEWDTFKNYTPEVEISFSQYWLPERGI